MKGKDAYLLQVIEDGEVTYTHTYDCALDAVRAYESFKDYGDSDHFREVVLVEPNGCSHGKSFVAPRLARVR